jgi:hypothetical protein
MSKRTSITWMLSSLLPLLAASSAGAGYTFPAFYVDHPTTNSQDWAAGVFASGGVINTDVNFQSMSQGAINQSFYNSLTHNDGVTIHGSNGTNDLIVRGPGPDEGGTNTPPRAGEGTSSLQQYLQLLSPGPSGGSSLTISFNSPVLAVGLFTIDYFGPDPSTNTLTLALYSGQNGKGTLLGDATAVHENFQPDGTYFMGYVSSSADIGSAVLMRGPDKDDDTIGIGSVLFATGGGAGSVPEPASIALLAAGAALLAMTAARRRRRAA